MLGLISMLLQKPNTPLGTKPNILRISEAEQPPVSPFAIRRGDTHSVDVFEKRCSTNEIDFLISKNIIGELEINIIKSLNNLIFATSVQITDIIVASGIEVTQKKVQQRIKLLYEKNVINTIKFTANDGTASFRAYTLSGNGYYILRKLGEKLHQVGFARTAATVEIKKILATNQLITKVRSDIPINYMTRQTLWSENDVDLIVRPHGIIMAENGDSFLIECIRDLQGFTKDMKEKYQRYNSVINRYNEVCITFSKKPTLIFLTENITALARIQETVSTSILRNQSVIFAYDGAVYKDVQNSFFSEIR